MKIKYQNILHKLNQVYTYAEIAYHIKEVTGKRYSPSYLRQVAVEASHLSDKLLKLIEQAYPAESTQP